MLPDLSVVDHHPVIEEIVDVLCNKTQNMDRGFFRAEVAYFIGKMASSMRASMITQDRGEIPVNIYALALATSGYGKGYSVSIVENEFMKDFKDRFMTETFPVLAEDSLWKEANLRSVKSGLDPQEEFDKIQKEFRSAGAFPFTFDSGTPPAVKQLRQKLLMANAGSINLQIDEIGSNLLGVTDVLTLFLELYDQGSVKIKLVKNTPDNQRGEDIDGKTPTNMLLFGTPSKLLDGSQTEDQFYSFLETGYARRCIFGYGAHSRALDNMTGEEAYKRLTQPAHNAIVDKWSRHFYQLADPAVFGWKMDVPEEVAIALLDYRLHCERLSDTMSDHEEIKKSELAHRYFKTLKLAGAFAFIDQSVTITLDHLYASMKLVEESGAAFQTILNREKAYVKLAKYITSLDHEVTHADLVEALPFYKSGQSARNEMMTLATAWGYRRHMIIKKNFVDGIEMFRGETLQQTDLDAITLSYSNHWAYNYLAESVPFDKLHILTQADGMHWCNHHFQNGHRTEDNVIVGFNMIALDVDEGISIDQFRHLMADYKYHLYTTKRHQTEGHGDRFRVMLPINYRLKLDNTEYSEFMSHIFSWLPFKTDESYSKREKKSESFSGGEYFYNTDGEVLDVLNFIPKTARNETHLAEHQALQSLDNLERWFAGKISLGNRNNQMIRYALTLVDAGWDLPNVEAQVHAFNTKLQNPMSKQEIDSTIMVTVAKRFSSNKQVA
jgi:hypothetical protein